MSTPPRPRRLRSRWPAILLLASFSALCISLAASNPPGSGPDEYAHYLKAAAAGRGQLVLIRDPPPLTGDEDDLEIEAWLDTQDRLVTLPERMSPDPFLCWGQPYFVGTCDHEAPDSSRLRDFPTYVGRYPPYSYVLPGLAMRLSAEPVRALYLGRLANLAASLLLIALGVAVLYDRWSPLSLAGLLAAATPMVLYVLSTLSSSSLEISAGMCFIACVLSLSRPGVRPKPWIWWAAGLSGALLAVVRDLGPLWLALGGALLAGLTGTRLLVEILRTDRARVLTTGAALALSIGLAAWWHKAQGAGSPPVRLTRHELIEALGLLPYIARQAIGVFGPLDTPLPWPAVALWTALVTLLVAWAAVLGNRRERLVLAASVITVALLAFLLQAIQQGTGFRAQARHLLPIAVGLPLLAGEIVHRHSGRLRFGGLALSVVAGCAAATHLIAWHTIGRRFSVGLSGPLAFANQAQWRPVLGWATWGVVTLVGALLLVLSTTAAISARRTT